MPIHHALPIIEPRGGDPAAAIIMFSLLLGRGTMQYASSTARPKASSHVVNNCSYTGTGVGGQRNNFGEVI